MFKVLGDIISSFIYIRDAMNPKREEKTRLTDIYLCGYA